MTPQAHNPLTFRFFRRAAAVLLSFLVRLDVQGLEHVPAEGPLVVSANHLHVLDLPIAFALIPRYQTVFAADKWEGTVPGWIMRLFANAIFVARGELDRTALNNALSVLRAGGALGVAPEGTRSRTGGLLPGKPGAVYLASRSGAAILPIAMWGQETATSDWPRLRRPHVHVRIAPPLVLPPEASHARAPELEAYTHELMVTLARMLPPAYRGAYADVVGGEAEDVIAADATVRPAPVAPNLAP